MGVSFFVCLSVSCSITTLRHAKMAEPIEMPFGVWTRGWSQVTITIYWMRSRSPCEVQFYFEEEILSAWQLTGWKSNINNSCTTEAKLWRNARQVHFGCRKLLTRMWASAQCDGRPAEYRWRPLFNAAKFGWRPLPECCALTLSKRKSYWNLLGCLKHHIVGICGGDSAV